MVLTLRLRARSDRAKSRSVNAEASMAPGRHYDLSSVTTLC